MYRGLNCQGQIPPNLGATKTKSNLIQKIFGVGKQLLATKLLNQADAWFPKIDIVRMSVCVFVSAPRAIKNYSREMKSE